MTEPGEVAGGGDEHKVRVTAIASFAELIREAHRAREALRELREEEERLNRGSAEGDRRATESHRSRAGATTELGRATREAGSATDEHAKASARGTTAARGFREELGRLGMQAREAAKASDAAAKAEKAHGESLAGAAAQQRRGRPSGAAPAGVPAPELPPERERAREERPQPARAFREELARLAPQSAAARKSAEDAAKAEDRLTVATRSAEAANVRARQTALSLQTAREQLARLSASTTASEQARERALLRVQSAEVSHAKALDTVARSQRSAAASSDRLAEASARHASSVRASQEEASAAAQAQVRAEQDRERSARTSGLAAVAARQAEVRATRAAEHERERSARTSGLAAVAARQVEVRRQREAEQARQREVRWGALGQALGRQAEAAREQAIARRVVETRTRAGREEWGRARAAALVTEVARAPAGVGVPAEQEPDERIRSTRSFREELARLVVTSTSSRRATDDLAKADDRLSTALIAERSAATKVAQTEVNLASARRRLTEVTASAQSTDVDRERALARVQVTESAHARSLATLQRAQLGAGAAQDRLSAAAARHARAMREDRDELDRAEQRQHRFGGAITAAAAAMRKSWRDTEQGTSGYRRLSLAIRSAVTAAEATRSAGGGGGDIFDRLSAGAEKFGHSVTNLHYRTQRLAAIGFLLATGLAPLVSLLGALAPVALAAANTLASLAGAAAALPGMFVAGGVAIGALVTALLPLKQVFKTFTAEQKAAADATAVAGETSRANADRLRTATHSVRSAERGVADAQYDSKRAQLALNDARKEAVRGLEDLRDAVNRASLEEEGSVLSLRRAQEEYAKTLADPNASLLDREEALYRVKTAEAGLQDTVRANRTNQEELTKAERAGIEGSSQVVDARRQIRDANQRVIDSQERLVEAQRDLTDAQHKATEPNVTLTKAQAAYQRALDALSPSARVVVTSLIGMREQLKEVQRATQERLFAPLVDQLGNAKSLLPTVRNLLTSAAGALGEVAAKGVAMLASGPWKRDFATLAGENVILIRHFGNSLLAVADAFRNIALAAAPFTRWITGALERGAQAFARWAEAGRRSGSIATFLERTRDRLSQTLRILGNLVAVFVSWGKVAQPITDWLLDALERVSQHWQDVAKDQEKATSPMSKWLRDVKPLLSEIAKFIHAVALEFARMAADPKNIQEATSILATLRKDVLPGLFRLFSDFGQSGLLEHVAVALGAIADAFAAFLEAGGGRALSTFFGTLSAVVTTLARIAATPAAASILGSVAVALGAIAAASIVGRFTGLFKLLSGLGWLVANRSRLRGTLADLAAGQGPGGPYPPGTAGGRHRAPGTGDVEPPTGRGRRVLPRVLGGALPGVAGAAGELAEDRSLSGAAGLLSAAARQLMAAARALGGAGVAGEVAEDVADVAGDVPDRRRGRHRARGRHRGGGAVRGVEEIAEDIVPQVRGRHRGGGAVRGVEEIAEDVVPRAGRFGRLGRAAGGLARIADPLTWAGLAVGGAADLGWLGHGGGATAGRAAGAVATGAGIGAGVGLLGGPFAPLTSPVGAAVGAGVGGAYSLARDPGLRRGVGNFFTDKLPDFFKKVPDLFMRFVGGPIADFFTKTIPGLFGRSTGAIGRFFGKVGEFVHSHLVTPVADFFTKTLPALPGRILGALAALPEKIAYALGFVWGNVEQFFTDTLPRILTETIPGWFESAYGWFDVHVVQPVGAFVLGIPGFFTRTIPRWFSSVRGWLARHVGQPVLSFIRGIPGFFTRTIPGWFSAVRRFFTRDVVRVVNNFVTGIPNFVTRTVPRWFSAVSRFFGRHVITPVRSFFTGIPAFITRTLPKWFSGVWDWFKTSVATPIMDFFKNLPAEAANLVKAGFKRVGGFFGKISDAFEKGEEAGRKQRGGRVGGTGTGDKTPLLAEPGEWVIRRRAVDRYGEGVMQMINEERVNPADLYAALNIAVRLGGSQAPLSSVSARELATSSVTNNTTNTQRGGLSMGDVTINNPVPERSDASLRRQLQIFAKLGDR